MLKRCVSIHLGNCDADIGKGEVISAHHVNAVGRANVEQSASSRDKSSLA
jgi:hypothetical protein